MFQNLESCVGCRHNIAEIDHSLCFAENLYGNEGVFIDPVTHRCQLTGQIIKAKSQHTTCLSRQPKITQNALSTLP